MLPRLNWPYLATVAAIGTASLVFIGGAITTQVYRQWSRDLRIGGGFSWPIVIGIDLACLCGAAAIFWRIYADAKTTIDSAGIARPSLLGNKCIAWPDVTKITVFGGVGYHIYAGATKIVFSPYVFHEPDRVIAALLDYVSSAQDEAHS